MIPTWDVCANKNERFKVNKTLAKIGLLSTLFVAGQNAVQAAAADSASITATATTAFEAVSVLVVAMAGFYIVLRVVKGIRR